MRFSVNAAALPGLAALMDRRSQDLVAGSAYVAQHTQIDWGDAGILNAIWGHHRDIVGAVDDFLVDAPDQMTEGELLAAVERGRGRGVWLSRADAHGLVDPPAQALGLAKRLIQDPR